MHCQNSDTRVHKTKPGTLTSVEIVALSHLTDFLRKGSVYMRVHHIFYRLLGVKEARVLLVKSLGEILLSYSERRIRRRTLERSWALESGCFYYHWD